MDGFNKFRSGLEVFAFDIEHLAADHAIDRADGVGNEANDLHRGCGWTFKPGEHFKGAGLQCVASQDGDGLAEGYVTGGLAAAQVVVVESGQVVVDKRVGVEHLEGRAEALDSLGSLPAMVTPAWWASTGLRRFPPAKREWRMAP